MISYRSSPPRVPMRILPPLGFLRVYLFFSFCKMVEDVINSLEDMKLTTDEEEVIVISEESQKEEIESCA